MSKIKTIVIYFIVICANPLLSQLEFSQWFFGSTAGLDFSTSPPGILTNMVLGTSEGCASISDNAGNLLFYTEGTGIATKNHTLMSNGSGLFGNQSSTQAALIVKQPGTNNNYYVFTTAGAAYHAYNIVDMNLAAGYGSVTVKNATLYFSSTEKQVAVRHCNGKDVWIIGHEINNNNFRSYLLTAAGLNTVPVISNIGEVLNGAGVIGHLKISPDGKKLAMACASIAAAPASGVGGFQLFDFNAATGVISNSLTLKGNVTAYGVEFSPDGTKLYGCTQNYTNSSSCSLFQWNICNSSTAAIIASEYSLSISTPLGSIQKAIDGKLYIAIPVISSQSLHVINNPNASGSGMGFVLNGQSIAPKVSSNGLPNFINNYTKPAPAPFTNTLSCQTASFTIPPIPTFSSGCSTTPYAPSGYLWDFGEPSSGAANSSTTTNPSHYYTNTGTYTVSLILFNNCTNDTLKQVVNVTTPGPKPEVAGTFTICKGDRMTYTATGGSSYLWHNNATTPTISLAPTTTTVYSVRTTSNGCSLNKSFTVNVNPCTGLSNVSSSEVENQIKFYPNPINNLLNLSSGIKGRLSIFDMSGRTVLESNIEAGENSIQTDGLMAGVYILSVSSTGSDTDAAVWRGRLVKVE